MEKYKNTNGDSGIDFYEIGEDSITVQFKDRTTYVYNYSSAGNVNVEKMKQLAQSGTGLNEFINRNVRSNWARKY